MNNKQSRDWWVKVPSSVILDKRLKPGPKLLWELLMWYKGGNDNCWPEEETLAGDLGVNERTVRRWKEDLLGYGYLHQKQRHNKSNLYVPCLPSDRDDEDTDVLSNEDVDVPNEDIPDTVGAYSENTVEDTDVLLGTGQICPVREDADVRLIRTIEKEPPKTIKPSSRTNLSKVPASPSEGEAKLIVEHQDITPASSDPVGEQRVAPLQAGDEKPRGELTVDTVVAQSQSQAKRVERGTVDEIHHMNLEQPNTQHMQASHPVGEQSAATQDAWGTGEDEAWKHTEIYEGVEAWKDYIRGLPTDEQDRLTEEWPDDLPSLDHPELYDKEKVNELYQLYEFVHDTLYAPA